MNAELRQHAESMLLRGLNELAPKNHRMFKFMYGRDGGRRSIADAEAMTLEEVISELPDDRIDLALAQIERTPRPTAPVAGENEGQQ